jgi:hypothetical protein
VADVSPRFAVRVLALNGPAIPPTFTVQLVAAIQCSKIVVENTDSSSSVQVRSDPSNPLTTKTIPAGIELTIDCKPDTGVAPAFKPGDVVAYLAPTVQGQPGPVVLTFFR